MKRTTLLFVALAVAFSAPTGCKKLKQIQEAANRAKKKKRTSEYQGSLSPEEQKDRDLSEKLQPYIKMTNMFTGRVYDSRNRYFMWIKDPKKGPTCKERYLYGLYTISPVDSYLKEVEKVQGNEPRLKDLEDGAVKYTTALKTLYPLLKKADRYYTQKDWKEDKCKGAQEMHPQLVAAWRDFEEGDRQLSKAIEKYNTAMHYRLLGRIAKQFGKTSDRYYHKKITLDARALLITLRAENAEKEPHVDRIAAEVKAFDALVQEMEEKAKSSQASGWSWFRSSADAYVKVCKEMMRRMKEHRKFTRTERDWLRRGSGWMVTGSYDAVLKKFNELIDHSNGVRWR